MRAPAGLRFLAPLALMGLIFSLSAQPDLSTGLGTWDLILRKLAHMGAFGSLALLWWWALGPLTGRAMPAAVGVTLAYAASDEYHQTFVAGRHGSPVDVAIDALGVAVAVLVARAWLRRRRPAPGTAEAE